MATRVREGSEREVAQHGREESEVAVATHGRRDMRE